MADTPQAPVRVRPWRVAALATSLGLTLASTAIASTGVVPGDGAAQAAPVAQPVGSPGPQQRGGGTLATRVVRELRSSLDVALGGVVSRPFPGDYSNQAVRPETRPDPGPGTGSAGATRRTGAEPAAQLEGEPPAGSGTRRRVVFDESVQQVWLVRENGSVRSTYPVSGSTHDNLDPGRYQVYSRSREATGFDYRSTMDYMVRFTQGENAAIGFHDIPTGTDGEPLQRWSELGTATSSGCIRQRVRDARELWRFATLGTHVVVVA